MGVAAGIALLSALAMVAVLPMMLLLVALVGLGSLGGWWAGLWFPTAFFVAVYNIATALELMNRPTASGVARLLAASALIILACPFLWVPW